MTGDRSSGNPDSPTDECHLSNNSDPRMTTDAQSIAWKEMAAAEDDAGRPEVAHDDRR